jgi:hypothetical protein
MFSFNLINNLVNNSMKFRAIVRIDRFMSSDSSMSSKMSKLTLKSQINNSNNYQKLLMASNRLNQLKQLNRISYNQRLGMHSKYSKLLKSMIPMWKRYRKIYR